MVESEGEGESVAAGSDCVFAGGVSGECDGGLFGVSVGWHRYFYRFDSNWRCLCDLEIMCIFCKLGFWGGLCEWWRGFGSIGIGIGIRTGMVIVVVVEFALDF